MAAVDVEHLVVRHGDLVAVDDVSFTARAGEVLALLGPNGAGKTSTVEVLEGYHLPTAGTVRVLGHDPIGDRDRVVGRIGVMLQDGGVYPGIRPPEMLSLLAAMYDDPADPDALLERVGLADRARSTWRQLSGGEQQRLSLAMALVGRPEVAFLDEPTAGVDVRGRQVIREIVRELAADGCAVVLCTHELDEAEKLADRVVIVDRGKVVATGTLDELRTGTDGEVRFSAARDLDVATLADHLGAEVVEVTPGEYSVRGATDPGPRLTAALTGWLADRDLALGDLRAGRQRLEDVFLTLTADTDEPDLRGPGTSARSAGPPGAQGKGSTLVKALLAQLRTECTLTLRNKESLLLTLGIPVGLLVFFSLVDVLPLDEVIGPTGDPVDVLAPGVLALAIMSMAMTGLAIATGFERSYGVLKRLGTTPLGRPRLLAAKIGGVVAIEAIQAAVLIPVGLALGWSPSLSALPLAGAVVLGTSAFAGLGLWMAGTLRAEITLALANGLYLVLLLLGGFLIPLAELPGPLRSFAEALPSSALVDLVTAGFTAADAPGRAWVVLALWAAALPVLAARSFRWAPAR